MIITRTETIGGLIILCDGTTLAAVKRLPTLRQPLLLFPYVVDGILQITYEKEAKSQ